MTIDDALLEDLLLYGPSAFAQYATSPDLAERLRATTLGKRGATEIGIEARVWLRILRDVDSWPEDRIRSLIEFQFGAGGIVGRVLSHDGGAKITKPGDAAFDALTRDPKRMAAAKAFIDRATVNLRMSRGSNN